MNVVEILLVMVVVRLRTSLSSSEEPRIVEIVWKGEE